MRFTVVGGGVSGLSAALLLAREGHAVRVLERAATLGGLAASEPFRGIPCDLGSHRLHPDALDRPLLREVHEARPFLTRPRRGVLLLRGRRIPYPPDPIGMLRALGARASLSLGAGLLLRKPQRRAFARWEEERGSATDVGFEAFVTGRVGEAAYRLFYKPYAEKVWGLDPRDLSQTVAKKRLSTSRPLSLFGRSAPRASFLYPAGGVSTIVDHLARELVALGVEVVRGTAFEAAGDGADRILFAGNLSDLGPTPLEHRGLYLVFVALPLERTSGVETYYSPDPEHWFGRVTELQNFSPELRRRGETILCVEIPEGAWGRTENFAAEPRRAELLEQLVRAGIVPPGVAPIEVRQRFVPNVYPLYRRGFQEAWRAAMQHAVLRGNLFPFGRQALFLHCNLDHCVDIATDVVEQVTSGASPEAWIASAERYLSLRVRD